VALVWNGTDFKADGGSETDESDSEQPLGRAEQVQAILNSQSSNLPPLPVDAKHVVANSNAVRNHTEAVPPLSRTHAQTLALSLPRDSFTVAEWVARQLRCGRKEATLRAAFCWALNPNKTAAWVCLKSGGNPSRTHVAKGLGLHLRMHPFTRLDVQRGRDLLPAYSRHRRNQLRSVRVSELAGVRGRRSAGELDAAIMMMVLQRGPLMV
jgi:hypothetical protein